MSASVIGPVYHPQAVRGLRVYQSCAKARFLTVPDVEADEDYAAAVEFAASEPGARAPVEATRRYVAKNRRDLLAKCRAARAMMRNGVWQGEGPSLDLAHAQGGLWRVREERRAFLSAMARAGAVEAVEAAAMVPQMSQPQQAQAVRPADPVEGMRQSGPDALRATAQAFHDTDEAWGAALSAQFGRRAAAARYSALGQGEPGTELRAIYVARYQAYAAWSAARGMPVMPDPVACALTVKAVA